MMCQNINRDRVPSLPKVFLFEPLMYLWLKYSFENLSKYVDPFWHSLAFLLVTRTFHNGARLVWQVYFYTIRTYVMEFKKDKNMKFYYNKQVFIRIRSGVDFVFINLTKFSSGSLTDIYLK